MHSNNLSQIAFPNMWLLVQTPFLYGWKAFWIVLHQKWFCKILWNCWKSSVKIFLKLWYWQIIWYLFVGFETIMLCFVHSVWFTNYVFYAEIWFVKTSNSVMKNEWQVIKLNPKQLLILKILFKISKAFKS